MKKVIISLGTKGTRFQIVEAKSDKTPVPEGCMRISGIIGVADIKNENGRTYSYNEYRKHIEKMNSRLDEGVYGELSHPKTMDINWERMTHVVENVTIDENGVATGQFLLMDTPHGKLVQSIAKAGKPIPVSSRGYGSIDENGYVTLDEMVTFDVIPGETGFKQARMYNMTESLKPIVEHKVNGDSGVVMEMKVYDYEAVTAYEKACVSESKSPNEIQSIVDTAVSEALARNPKPTTNSDNHEFMFGFLPAIDKIIESKISDLEKRTQLRITEACKATTKVVEDNKLSNPDMVLDSIQEWVETYVNSPLKQEISEINDTISDDIKTWVVEDFSPIVEDFVHESNNHVMNGVENFIKDEYSPIVDNQIKEYCENLSTSVQNWAVNDLSPVIETYVSESINEKAIVRNPSKINLGEGINKVDNQLNTVLSIIDEEINKGRNKKMDSEINESKRIEQENPIYFQFMPETIKTVYAGMTNENKKSLVNQAKNRDLKTEDDVIEFWSTRNFSELKINNYTHNTSTASIHTHSNLSESFQSRLVGMCK